MRIASAIHSPALALAACLAWPGTASALTDLVLNVDCGAGQSIGQALNRPTLFDRRLVIAVSGACNENVTIARDDVVVRSAAGGSVAATDATKPAILVDAAKRVLLENLVVTGGHEGVRVVNGASATIRGSTVRNAALHGVLVNFGANARIEGSILESNGQYGIVVNASSATLVNSTVRSNNASGLAVVSTGYALLGEVDDSGVVCCGNTIEGNGLDGVTVARAATARLYGNTIRGNGAGTNRWGVLAVEQSTAWLEGGNLVSGNGGANGGGGAFVRASTLRTGQGDQPVIPSTNEISDNFVGIGTNTASLDLRGGRLVVTRNRQNGINLEQGSRLRTDNTMISDNSGIGILVGTASGVHLLGANNNVSNNVLGGLVCLDAGSHFSGNPVGIVNNPGGNVNCTPF